jgi:muramidase (phage lysozyme)
MTGATLIGAGLVAASAWALWQASRSNAPDETGPGAGDLVPGLNLPNLVEAVTPQPPDTDTAARNLAAFLMTIRHAEGTAGPDGYRMMFGGRLFADFSDHPRQAHQFTDQLGRTLWTTAAGAYQFLAVSPLPGGGQTRVDTWDRLQRRLALPDFSPVSQDRAAVELIDECGAIGDAKAGRIDSAIAKCRRVWASLPGAGYAQPERSRDWLAARYVQAGGVLG